MTPGQKGSTALLKNALHEAYQGLDKLALQLQIAGEPAPAEAVRQAGAHVDMAAGELQFLLDMEKGGLNGQRAEHPRQ